MQSGQSNRLTSYACTYLGQVHTEVPFNFRGHNCHDWPWVQAVGYGNDLLPTNEVMKETAEQRKQYTGDEDNRVDSSAA